MTNLNTKCIHPSWQPLVKTALLTVDSDYMKLLCEDEQWLPGKDMIFSAFSHPLQQTQFILFGESPYPRRASANGYAFWDQAVDGLWSPDGLSKRVNRATSLRNILKMLLLARGDLSAENLSQAAIAAIDKTPLIHEIDELFAHLLQHGFLLLNATLSLTHKGVNKDAKVWQPFMSSLLETLYVIKPDVKLILFGNIAKAINRLPAANEFQQFHCEHPYNISFITNPDVISFFKPFDLLAR